MIIVELALWQQLKKKREKKRSLESVKVILSLHLLAKMRPQKAP